MSSTHSPGSNHSQGNRSPNQHRADHADRRPPPPPSRVFNTTQFLHTDHEMPLNEVGRREEQMGRRKDGKPFGKKPDKDNAPQDSDDGWDTDLSTDSLYARSDINSSDGHFDDEHAGEKTIRDLKKALAKVMGLNKHYEKQARKEAVSREQKSETDGSDDHSPDRAEVEKQQAVHGMRNLESHIRNVMKDVKREVRGKPPERDSSPSSSVYHEPPSDTTSWRKRGARDQSSSEEEKSRTSSGED
ncbi:MAG: hypothetical protein Q9162_007843 [Coniocarpon cinnabarinum]